MPNSASAFGLSAFETSTPVTPDTGNLPFNQRFLALFIPDLAQAPDRYRQTIDTRQTPPMMAAYY